MRTAAIISATFLLAASAHAQVGTQGRFDFLCKDGKPVAIRIITITPGEVVVPMPKEMCPKPALRDESLRPAPPRPKASEST